MTSGGRAGLKEGGQRLIRKTWRNSTWLRLEAARRKKRQNSLLTRRKINPSFFPHNRQLAFRVRALALFQRRCFDCSPHALPATLCTGTILREKHFSCIKCFDAGFLQPGFQKVHSEQKAGQMFYQRCVKAFLLLPLLIVISIVRFFLFMTKFYSNPQRVFTPLPRSPSHLGSISFLFSFFSPDVPLTHPDGGEHGGLTEGARRHGD